jgi:hypothetical protein
MQTTTTFLIRKTLHKYFTAGDTVLNTKAIEHKIKL